MSLTEAKLREAVSVAPSPRQLAWQELEFYGFLHFGMNTFTGREWGDGTASPACFDPAQLDAEQWAAALKSAGMRGAILTCKHHDGFCLWPSAHTDYSVKHAPWKGGKGDVVGEVAAACRKAGLKFGVYLSPWDRHDARYGSGKPYDDYYVAQLTELLTGYGELFCVWLDGACGEGPNGKRQAYDWPRYYETIRALQPGAVISVCGPDVRWCGNEAGHCRPSEWSVVPAQLRDAAYTAQRSQQADDAAFARRVSREDEDLGSRAALAADGAPGSYWQAAPGQTEAVLTLTFPQAQRVGCVALGEYLPAGQRIEAGCIEADGRCVARFTVVGHKRICRFAPVRANALTVRITAARAEPALRLLAAYR